MAGRPPAREGEPQRFMNAPPRYTDLAMFSPRERQIIAALTAAKQVREIALELHLTPNTVKSYIKALYLKAEVHSVRELMLKFPPAGRAADERLDSLSRVLGAADVSQLQAEALAMLRVWTGARQALCWEISGDDLGRLPHPHGGRPLGCGPAAACAEGPILMPAGEVARESFLRAAAGGRPLQGEVCLVVLRLAGRTWLLALADPAAGAFTPDALKLVRALVHLAEHHAGSFAPRIATAAAAGEARRKAG